MYKNRLFLFLLVVFFTTSINLIAKEASRKNLTKAIEKGDLKKVQSLIEKSTVGIDELSKDTYGKKSPLIEAAYVANIPIMKYLIEKGANIEGISEENDTPLVKFIEKGSRLPISQLINMVLFFLDHGADINSPGKDGITPLMMACSHTIEIDLIETLLDKGARINVKAEDGSTAYIISMLNNNLKAYRLLISYGADTNVTYKGMLPLSVLAFNGKIFMMKILLEETNANIHDFNPNGTTPLICAAVGKKDAIVEFLVNQGADINAKTRHSIDVGTKDGLLFLPKWVRFPRGSTALNFAVTLGDISLIHLLIELGGIKYQDVAYKELSIFDRNFRYY